MRGSKYQLDKTNLQCTQPGCTFTAQNKAGLVNHQQQKHGAAAQEILICCRCHQNFKQRGYRNHTNFCNQNPESRDYVEGNKVRGSDLTMWRTRLTQVKSWMD